ncbi:MAG: medium chain dehydrogenase/reductase family protein [Salibacteraceae bacterium]
MKAIVLVRDGNPEDAFEMQDVPTPKVEPNQVLVKVSHFGLNYADIMARKGLYNGRPELPCVLGYEVVGEISAIGSKVKGFAIGDYVLAFTLFGGYAEFCVAEATGVVKLGAGTNPAEATALATQYCTAWYAACMMVNLQPKDRVLIHAAAGGVGTALVQLAKLKGCEVFGTASHPHKIEYLKTLGVDHPINYRTNDFSAEVTRILNGHKIDVAFDPIGGSNFKRTNALLGTGGRIITFGASEWSSSKGTFIDKLKLAFGFGFLHPIALLMKSKSIIGVNMLEVGKKRPDYLQTCLQEVYALYQNGTLKPTVDSVHPVSNLSTAHRRLEGRQTIGKVVVEW